MTTSRGARARSPPKKLRAASTTALGHAHLRMAVQKFALSLLTLWSVGLCFTQSPQEGDVRILHNYGNILPNCGRVELYHDGRWGTVCDNSWNKREATVVCRQLGYREGASFRCLAACLGMGAGDIPVWLEGLVCPANGHHISHCLHRGWGVHDCRPAEDAGVCCKGERIQPPSSQKRMMMRSCSLPSPLPPPPPKGVTNVRISCPCAAAEDCRSCPGTLYPTSRDCNATDTSPVERMLEVLYGDQWIPVSRDGWDMNAARVACGELGYPLTLAPPSDAQVLLNDMCTEKESRAIDRAFGASSIIAQSIHCSGRESKLTSCSVEIANGASSFQPVTLRCEYKLHPECCNNLVSIIKIADSSGLLLNPPCSTQAH